MHARARHRVERRVRDVACERVPEIEDVALAIAQAARAETHDRVLAGAERELLEVAAGRIGSGAPMLRGARVELREIRETERAASDGEPIDDDVLRTGELLDAIREELLERRRKPHRVE